MRLFNANAPIERSQSTVTIRDDDMDRRTITTTDNPNPPYDGVSGTFSSSTHLPPPGFPVVETTGVPVGTVLTPHIGRLEINEDGTVIDALDVDGTIVVKANNVTIKNTRVTGHTSSYLISMDPEYKNLVVLDSRLRGIGRCSATLCCSNYTARRILVTGCSDGVKIGTNTVIEDSLITERYRETASDGSGTHNDGLQGRGGKNNLIRHNTILGPYRMSTSAIILQAALKELQDTVVKDNYLSGGGYTIYVSDKNFPLRNVVIRNNVFENYSFSTWL